LFRSIFRICILVIRCLLFSLVCHLSDLSSVGTEQNCPRTGTTRTSNTHTHMHTHRENRVGTHLCCGRDLSYNRGEQGERGSVRKTCACAVRLQPNKQERSEHCDLVLLSFLSCSSSYRCCLSLFFVVILNKPIAFYISSLLFFLSILDFIFPLFVSACNPNRL
jgi:hypothetical protein